MLTLPAHHDFIICLFLYHRWWRFYLWFATLPQNPHLKLSQKILVLHNGKLSTSAMSNDTISYYSSTRSSFKIERSGSVNPPKDLTIKPRKSSSLTADHQTEKPSTNVIAKSTTLVEATVAPPTTPRWNLQPHLDYHYLSLWLSPLKSNAKFSIPQLQLQRPNSPSSGICSKLIHPSLDEVAKINVDWNNN